MALTLAPSQDQPAVTSGALSASALASTIIAGSPGWLREKRVGVAETTAGASQTSTADLDLTGSSHFRYLGVPAAAGVTANPGQYVQTNYKPGSDASHQAATWLFNVEFTTDSPTVAFRMRAPVANPSLGRILVNGLPIEDSPSAAVATAGAGYYILLTFPDARTRTISVLALGNVNGGFGGVAVGLGYTVVKPTDPQPLFAVLGDSYVNGASPVGNVDTFAWRLAWALGYGRGFLGAGIGGTGFITDLSGMPDSSFDGRVSAVLAMSPDVVLVMGGRNDTATGLQAAVTSLLGSLAGPDLWVATSASESTQAAVRSAIAAGAAASGVTFLDEPIDVLPKLADGIHPTLDGHKTLTDELLALMQTSTPATAAGALTLAGTAGASAVAASAGSLALEGAAIASGSTTATGSLTLIGSAAASAGITATGSLTIIGTASATASTSATGTLGITGAVTATGQASATGALVLTGSAVAGSFDTASAAGVLTLSGTATGVGRAVVSGTIQITGTAIASAAATASGALALTGAASAGGKAQSIGVLTILGGAVAHDGSTPSLPDHGDLTIAAPVRALTLSSPAAGLEVS